MYSSDEQIKVDLERKLQSSLESKTLILEEKLQMLEEARAAEERLLQVQKLVYYIVIRT